MSTASADCDYCTYSKLAKNCRHVMRGDSYYEVRGGAVDSV